MFSGFFCEAKRLQKAYSSSISILVGTEVDWIRPSSKIFIEKLLSNFQFDLFIGSVHHVHGIPIDYNEEMFDQARRISGESDERLAEDYFDLQYEMLNALKPPIVGHFDLIRLKSRNPDESFRRWPGVWKKVQRNLTCVVEYGGIFELNSAALRKGLKEPYPSAEICRVR